MNYVAFLSLLSLSTSNTSIALRYGVYPILHHWSAVMRGQEQQVTPQSSPPLGNTLQNIFLPTLSNTFSHAQKLVFVSLSLLQQGLPRRGAVPPVPPGLLGPFISRVHRLSDFPSPRSK